MFLVKVPLVLFIHGLLVYFAAHVLFFYPTAYFALDAYATFVVGVVAVALVSAGVVWLVSYTGLPNKLFRWILDWERRRKQSGPGIVHLMKQRVKDKHDKICRLIAIQGENS